MSVTPETIKNKVEAHSLSEPHMNTKSSQHDRGNDLNPQPLHALQLEDALLRIKTVSQATGLSTATLYRKVAAGELAIVKMGKRCSRFRASDVRAFIQAQGRT
jgi:excisionase family DNA binding protein